MKIKFTVLLGILILLTGCLGGGTTVKKDDDARMRAKIQEEKADKAFKELDRGFDENEELEEPDIVKSREPQASSAPAAEVKDYSSSRYLKATGIGQSDAEARRMAKAELSNIFESKISSEVMTSAKAFTDVSGGENFKKSIEHNIRVMSAVELEGVEIGNTWFDEKSRSYYAEAVLDRYKARDLWEDDIERIDAVIDAEYNNLSGLPSPVSKLVPIRKILKLWLEKEVIVSRLKVIGFSASDMSDDRVSSLIKMVPQIRSSMHIYLDIEGEYASQVKNKVSRALTSDGFNISNSKQNADVMVSGSVTTEPVNLNNPDFKFARARASLAVTDLATGDKVGNVSTNVRKGHINITEAENKAVQSVSGTVAEELLKLFGFEGLMN